MKITRDKAVQQYYDTHKAEIDKAFDKPGSSITPKQRFEAVARASINSRFGTKGEAKEALNDVVTRWKYGNEVADVRKSLVEAKRNGLKVDFRKKEFRVTSFEPWVDLPDDTYLIDRDDGSWNGGTLHQEYLNRYSVNRGADLVLWQGYGNTVNSKESPYQVTGTMTINELETLLGHAI